jgi:hypothetical protein
MVCVRWMPARGGGTDLEDLGLTCYWGDDGRETEEGGSSEDHNKVDL